MMERLSRGGIEASIRYVPGGEDLNGMFEVCVADEDAQNAGEVLDLRFGEHAEVQVAPPAHRSIVACPRCGRCEGEFPSERIIGILLLSVPLLGIPAIIWFFYVNFRGTRKRCVSCSHEWRSKP